MVEKSTIKDLREEEGNILSKREYHKNEIRVLTKELYNTRQKIKYAKKNEAKKPSSMFEMFGKQRSELTAEELKEYNRVMQKNRRKKL